MTLLSGSIIEVSTVPLGDTLDGAHAAGVTVLTVNAIVDFEGVAEVLVVDDSTDPGTEHTLGVASIDTEAQTITLDAPLPVALDDDAFVAVVPAGEEKQAQVLVDGSDEAITARVPHSLYGYLPDGIRDPGAEESVEVVDDGGEWSVADVLGVTPDFDGGVIDPETLPEPEPPASSDGLPPDEASVATFIGGIGSVFFRWTEIDNADLVTYRLHVASALTTDPAPVVPTDGIAEVAAGVGITSASVRKLADGTPIVGDGSVTYYGVVTVEDRDGPGPNSNVASGVPAQVTGPDIAVGALTADLLVANDALIDALNATDFTAVTMTGPTIQTAAAGKRILIENDGLIHFYSGDAAEATEGSIEADATNTPADPRMRLAITSGSPTGRAAASLILQSESVDGDEEPTITLVGDVIRLGTASPAGFQYGGVGDKIDVPPPSFNTAPSPDSVWFTPALSGAYTNLAGREVRYMRDLAGNVHLRGVVNRNAAANGATLFTLPVGYRPAQTTQFLVDTTPVSALGSIGITTGGVVSLSLKIGAPTVYTVECTFSVLT